MSVGGSGSINAASAGAGLTVTNTASATSGDITINPSGNISGLGSRAPSRADHQCGEQRQHHRSAAGALSGGTGSRRHCRRRQCPVTTSNNITGNSTLASERRRPVKPRLSTSTAAPFRRLSETASMSPRPAAGTSSTMPALSRVGDRCEPDRWHDQRAQQHRQHQRRDWHRHVGRRTSVFNAGSIPTAAALRSSSLVRATPDHRADERHHRQRRRPGTDTFQLGGTSGSGSFNAALIGPAAQYRGFASYNKVDTSTGP